MPLCKAIFSDKIIKRIYSAFFSYWLVFRSLLFLFLHKKKRGSERNVSYNGPSGVIVVVAAVTAVMVVVMIIKV